MMSEANVQELRAEIARLNTIIRALINRSESSANIQGADFNLFQTAITLEDDGHRRTEKLEATLQDNEKIATTVLESEDHYRAFFLGAKVPMLLIDPTDGRIVDANAAAESYYGYSLSRIKGMNIDQINVLTHEEIAQQMSDAERDKKNYFHFRHRLADGEIRDVEVHSGSVHLKDHHLLYSIVHDITERHKAEIEVKEQLYFIEQLVEAIPNPLFYKDDQGRYLGCNHAFERYVGRPRQELVGKSVYEISPKELADRYYAADKELFDNPGVQTYEAKVKSTDGEQKEVMFYKATFNKSDGSLGGLVGVILDITERKRAEENLRIIASVFDSSLEGIVITDGNNMLLDVNPAFTGITGYSREELIGKDPKLLNSGRHNKAFYAEMWQSLEEKKAWRGEIWNRRKSGEIYVDLLSIAAICDDDGVVQRYVGIFSDISYLKTQEAELSHVANYDALTGIPNRRLLTDRMEQAIARAQRSGKLLSVCYIDLDGFKLVNDLYGHATGDQLLIEITRRLQDALRAGDTLARLGGDEFVVLFSDLANEQECRQILERVLEIVAIPVVIGNQEAAVSASIGVTFYTFGNVDGDTLLRRADQAMYIAKQSGKSRFHIYTGK